MGTPFKDRFDGALLGAYVDQLAGPGFDPDRFRCAALPLEGLELKARVQRIADALHQALPPSFPDAAAILEPRLPPPLVGTEEPSSTFGWWPLCTFVERHGVAHPQIALPFLRRLTRTFSAEFAVRPFLAAAPEATLRFLHTCLEDPDPHIRRWVSEGTRPRLPWGQQLSAFVVDPSHTLPLLEALKDDPEPYVRRSVANHLGDIAKDHPDRAVAVARRWAGDGPLPARGGDPRHALVRHALRHLVKRGHRGALALMGFGPPKVEAELTASGPVVLGHTLELTLTLRNPTGEAQTLLVDLGLRFRGANGALRGPKVFKWTTLDLDAGAVEQRTRRQRLPAVTTRTHHAGEQEAVALVNGQPLARAAFVLQVP